MPKNSMSSLDKLPRQSEPPLRSALIFRILLVIFFVVILAVGFGLIELQQRFSLTPALIWATLTNDTSVLKQTQGRTNVVLFGISGGTHEGSNLTDTILVLSLRLDNQDSVMISVPRDIWIPSFKDKINAAYKFGEEKNPGSGGLTLAKAVVEEVVGAPIHYALLIDFSGFRELVDALGGIEVNVAETFTDNKYPIAGKETDLCDGDPEYNCRYETITFTKGTEQMDGERALKYVRSRHAEGESGTDFSRGKRQQVVLVAVKNQILSRQLLTDRSKISTLIPLVNKTIITDMLLAEEAIFGRTLLNNTQSIRQTALTQDEPEKGKPGLLINPPQWQYSGLWVLVPKAENCSQIHAYIKCVLENNGKCEEQVSS